MMKATKRKVDTIEAMISNLRQRAFTLASESVDMKRKRIMIAYSPKAIVINTMHTMHHASRYDMVDTEGVSSRTLLKVLINIRRIVTSKDILPGIFSGGM